METIGGSPVEGRGSEELFDFREPVGVVDTNGALGLSLKESVPSESNSKENPVLSSLVSSLLGRADEIGDGTGRSVLRLPSNGGVPGNIGSCHSKCGVERL